MKAFEIVYDNKDYIVGMKEIDIKTLRRKKDEGLLKQGWIQTDENGSEHFLFDYQILITQETHLNDFEMIKKYTTYLSENLSENLNNSISFSEYIASQLDNVLRYIDYLNDKDKDSFDEWKLKQNL